jgi:hypothetical protein
MSKKKINKKSQWGGLRKNAGAKPRQGGTIKKCVSVTEEVWHDAMQIWNGKASRLVDRLLADYIANKSGIREMEPI